METINLQTRLNNTLRPDQVQGPRSTVNTTAPPGQETAPSENQRPVLEPVAGKRVLDMNELATLHMLFGTEKPVEQNLYGQRQVPQIHKGHLLDISA